MFAKCISKPLCNVLYNMEWDPLSSEFDAISSTAMHLYNPEVRRIIDKNCNDILDDVITVTDSSSKWNYTHPMSLVFHGECKMPLRDHVTPHLHQKQVLTDIYDEVNKTFTSATIQSPCASGKSLLSLLIISKVMEVTGACALYVTINSTAIAQVVNQAVKFFHISPDEILVLDTAESCNPLSLINRKYKIVIATYQLLTASEHPDESKHFFDLLFCIITFGVVILDEAHYSSAKNYKQIYRIKAALKYGVSATLKRMDNLLVHLTEYTGPYQIKIDRDALIKQNLIPDVSLQEFHIDEPEHRDRLMSVRKMELFYDILQRHIGRNQSIIAFFETIRELDNTYACMNNILFQQGRSDVLLPSMKGDTNSETRISLINTFRQRVNDNKPVVLFLSSVGNAAYDFLCEIVVQVRCSDGSGPIAAQRIGRVQRYIKQTTVHVSYTLVATGTSEINHAQSRRDFLDLDNYKTSIIKSSQIYTKTPSDVHRRFIDFVMELGTKHQKRQRGKPVNRKKTSSTRFSALKKKIGKL